MYPQYAASTARPAGQSHRTPQLDRASEHGVEVCSTQLSKITKAGATSVVMVQGDFHSFPLPPCSPNLDREISFPNTPHMSQQQVRGVPGCPTLVAFFATGWVFGLP